jgi:bile acid-coenzyme A ligase
VPEETRERCIYALAPGQPERAPLSVRCQKQAPAGGTNVVPAEVKAILTLHPGVRDEAVIGLKDDDLGRRVHALIEPANADAPPALEGLDAHLRLHLASYKLARGYEIVAILPRDEGR